MNEYNHWSPHCLLLCEVPDSPGVIPVLVDVVITSLNDDVVARVNEGRSALLLIDVCAKMREDKC